MIHVRLGARNTFACRGTGYEAISIIKGLDRKLLEVPFGIGDGLLRISVGIEHVEDIWADLAEGLAALHDS